METIAGWVAPIATTLAALMTASNLGSRVTGYGFVIFTVGSIAWLTLGIVTDQPNLLWQNIVLTILNLFGIWRWLGRQAKIEDGGASAAAQSEHSPDESLFPASILTKADVITRDREKIGTSVDAMIGSISGRPAYIVVAEGGVAGVGERLRRLEWSDARVEIDTIIIASDAESIDQMPVIERDSWPAR